MSTTDMKGPESTGDAAVNEAVGHAAGAAPVAAQTTVDEADVPAAPELEEENLSLPGQETSAAHAALNRGARKRSFEVSDHEVPKSHVEEWRFTPLRRFAPLFQDVATDDSAVEYQVEVPEGASEPGTLAIGQAPRGTVLVPEDIASAIASARSEQALHLTAAKNGAYDAPFRIDIAGRGADRRGNGHIVLETEESSSAIFVLNHTGSAQYAQNVEMIIGDNSTMTVISLHDWDDDAIHIATHHARVGRDAKLKHVAVTLGGSAVRFNAIGEYGGPGGEIEKLGLYFSDEDQFFENRLFVDHSAPHCTSNVAYKGALQGKKARSVWVGDVLIRKEAEGTNTYELNRNLVLTEGARADSVPNLEIETGEIEGAGHAAATGRFDDEQLFYLRARGISELEARRLVVRGFFAEIIQQIDVPEIRERLSASIEDELARSMN
ncbi:MULTISPECIES: Fe-S cluster assembly protein SufD [Brachybacterium]|uniref:Fe-S cluster assembly protein SufD n=1 Tax=Brachybacterium alimentarium TaxID=47845 RepID=A0A2A3YKE9_9MICO|nr:MULTISPECIES: Fe-S cluster assembly protein SufD [Brachybacterium]PCC34271.1 Fe-S cluster assembly protein SufD [Brachybacterium alimentarium]PCC39826.1 Fe-S cluster assembly protein SufD [Brachybacterium alimentarium]RCS67102.1 Fe-S cluster assembly protein SufD [Brachybacterium sp. JB7]RCS68280.1 Fe-S cluster assembly protein SufD [Brachybacterium alimentarium]RCS69869.1 Fe-S cluster assembly protein SufD [Brachybacterium alimentarium]